MSTLTGPLVSLVKTIAHMTLCDPAAISFSPILMVTITLSVGFLACSRKSVWMKVLDGTAVHENVAAWLRQVFFRTYPGSLDWVAVKELKLGYHNGYI